MLVVGVELVVFVVVRLVVRVVGIVVCDPLAAVLMEKRVTGREWINHSFATSG